MRRGLLDCFIVVLLARAQACRAGNPSSSVRRLPAAFLFDRFRRRRFPAGGRIDAQKSIIHNFKL